MINLNDAFGNRTTLSGFDISVTGTNVGFTGEPGEPDHAAVSEVRNSAWWSWTAPLDGVVSIDTFGSDFDTTLAVYTGETLTDLVEIVSNDDGGNTLQSAATFAVSGGTTYQIAVDGFSNSTGNIELNLGLNLNVNDDFSDRIALSGTSIATTGTNIGFTGEPAEPDHAAASDVLNSAWWSWTAPNGGTVSLDTFGSDFDTTLAVYTGESLDSLTAVASSDDAAGVLQSAVAFDVVPGTTYQIAVDGFSTSTGAIDLNLNLGEDSPGPTATVDLILDFDGGTVEAGQSYLIPTAGFAGFDFPAFTAFDQNDGSAGDLNEQIFQVLAGVREDFADFNVRVIWDDQGVNSPFFDGQDTVVMVVGGNGDVAGAGNIFGIASSVDVPPFTGGPLQSEQDTAFAFRAAHVDVGPNTFNEIRELIDTISHEAGHTFGLSHTPQQDSEGRQLVTTASQNSFLDSRFSPEILNHTSPEINIPYAETTRLNDAVGAAPVLPGDTQSSQTLPQDPTTLMVGEIDPTDLITASGSIDFLGDRDAFRFETTSPGQYTVMQIPTAGSLLTPSLTLWDSEGDFMAVGSGSNSTIRFNTTGNETYYAIAGSDVDRLGNGVAPAGEIGGYALMFS